MEGPYKAKVTYGFGDDFGAGKTPFIPQTMIALNQVLHVLLSDTSRKYFNTKKWSGILKKELGYRKVHFYDPANMMDKQEWLFVEEVLDEEMGETWLV